MPPTAWHWHIAGLLMAASCPGVSSVLDSYLHISLVCQGFFQDKLLISMINTAESDPPSFWVENANHTLMRLRALSITGQDESVVCLLLRLSQWCFYLQLHAYPPCFSIQLLPLCCTDIQGQSCFQMGTNAPLQIKKEKCSIESALKQSTGMHRMHQKTLC